MTYNFCLQYFSKDKTYRKKLRIFTNFLAFSINEQQNRNDYLKYINETLREKRYNFFDNSKLNVLNKIRNRG